ncbi:hypothetical protein [Prosthecobacter sp.]|uniref:hypothetical protein n=1 Tax=Prosthecobacter sp. TaxID=1965333 RepID=UPI003784E1FA
MSRERIQIVNTHSSRDGWLAGMASRLHPMSRNKTQRMCRARRELVENWHSLDAMLDQLNDIYADDIDRPAA